MRAHTHAHACNLNEAIRTFVHPLSPSVKYEFMPRSGAQWSVMSGMLKHSHCFARPRAMVRVSAVITG